MKNTEMEIQIAKILKQCCWDFNELTSSFILKIPSVEGSSNMQSIDSFSPLKKSNNRFYWKGRTYLSLKSLKSDFIDNVLQGLLKQWEILISSSKPGVFKTSHLMLLTAAYSNCLYIEKSEVGLCTIIRMADARNLFCIIQRDKQEYAGVLLPDSVYHESETHIEVTTDTFFERNLNSMIDEKFVIKIGPKAYC